MREAKLIVEAIKQAFKDFDKQYPDLDSFSEADVQQVLKRTKSRRRSDFIDGVIDSLNLTNEELKAWEQFHDDENSEKAEKLFHQLIEAKETQKAEYLLNNMKSIWSMEKRTEMVKSMAGDYVINPWSELVDTKHNVKKEGKERAKKNITLVPDEK